MLFNFGISGKVDQEHCNQSHQARTNIQDMSMVSVTVYQPKYYKREGEDDDSVDGSCQVDYILGRICSFSLPT